MDCSGLATSTFVSSGRLSGEEHPNAQAPVVTRGSEQVTALQRFRTHILEALSQVNAPVAASIAPFLKLHVIDLGAAVCSWYIH
jgi:hypothetical protein